MANTQIAISKNGKTILATAGKYCERDIDINVSVASAGDNIPSYVKTEADSLALKVASAQGNRVFTLAAITDLHHGNGNYTNGILHASQALSYINKQITLDAFAVLGDYTDGYPIDNVDDAFGDCRKINSLMSSMETIPNLRLQGNHDFYNNYAQFVHYHIQAYSEGVTWGNKNGGYFYRDFADKKLRIICVNTTETDNANLTVSDGQYNWFIGALDLSTKSDASDWQILILSHHPLDWYSSSYVFCYILEAYKSGSSWSNGGVSCNFAGKNSATLIGNIHGHIHNLLVGYINKGNVNTSNPTEVLRACTPEACIGRANQYEGAWKEATTYSKTTNGAKDTSFVVYCIDLDSQSIKAFCYGAGYDREISYAPIAPTVYNITNNLTNCTASGANTIVKDGTAAITIVANDEYKLPDTINVSGASYTWDKSTGTVILSNPTKDVTITVVAIEIPVNYTNQIPLSINADGSQFVGTNGEDGYKMGYRMNSNGTETEQSNFVDTLGVTGYIPIKTGDTVYFKNLQMHRTNNSGIYTYSYITLFESDFSLHNSAKVPIISSSLDYLFGDSFTVDADGYVTSFQLTDKYNSFKDGGYLRISAPGMSSKSVITINEPINAYKIVNYLTNCTATGAVNIAANTTTSIVITADANYSLPDSIVVSGASYTWDKSTGTVVLSNPTSDVVITIVAVEVELPYKNQIKLSINADGTQFVGDNGEDGYKTEYRINSSGSETAQSGYAVTGFIPIKSGDIVYLDDLQMHHNDGTNYCNIGFYDSDFAMNIYINKDGVSGYDYLVSEYTYDENGYITSFRIVDEYNEIKEGYMRISAQGITANSVITVNEPINTPPIEDEPELEPTPDNNLIRKSINADGTPYNNGIGWKTNYRLNSSGAEVATNGIEVTGFMPVSREDVIYLKGITIPYTGTNNMYQYLALYDSNFNKILSPQIDSNIGNYGATKYDEENNLIEVNVEQFLAYYGNTEAERAAVAYFRISAEEISNSSIITVNEPIVTNQIPLSINSDGTAYIGANGEKGYKTGYRLNSSGVEAALSDWEVTGFIPFNRTDVFYFKNIQWCGGDSPNNDYIGLYDENFTKITSTKMISEWLVSRDAAFYGITLDTDNNITSIDCNKWCIAGYGSLVNAQWDSVKYIRFSLYDVTNDSIITINEPIGDTPDAPIEPTVYNITNNLTNCTASGASTITENGTASIVISANDGYELPDTITVSGASYTWDKSTGTVVLSNPTGNVTITVVAVEVKPKYTNQIPLSINADGSQYVGTNGEDGYKPGYRLNSSGAETAATNLGVTGFIPIKKDDIIYVKNMKIVTTSGQAGLDYCYIALYDTAFTSKASVKATNYVNGTSHTYLMDSFTTDENGYVTSFRILDKYNEKLTDGAGYLRISAYQMNGTEIITINEPIE